MSLTHRKRNRILASIHCLTFSIIGTNVTTEFLTLVCNPRYMHKGISEKSARKNKLFQVHKKSLMYSSLTLIWSKNLSVKLAVLLRGSDFLFFWVTLLLQLHVTVASRLLFFYFISLLKSYSSVIHSREKILQSCLFSKKKTCSNVSPSLTFF